jgi:hypothetical protein
MEKKAQLLSFEINLLRMLQRSNFESLKCATNYTACQQLHAWSKRSGESRYTDRRHTSETTIGTRLHLHYVCEVDLAVRLEHVTAEMLWLVDWITSQHTGEGTRSIYTRMGPAVRYNLLRSATSSHSTAVCILVYQLLLYDNVSLLLHFFATYSQHLNTDFYNSHTSAVLSNRELT